MKLGTIEHSREVYQKGVRVWVPSEEHVWREANVVDQTGDALLVQDEDGGEYTYNLTQSEALPPLRNPDILEAVNDLTTLSYLHEPAVLHNLHVRYMQTQIYTYCGIVLVAINPYQTLPIYNADIMMTYSGRALGELDPHIFAVAEAAFRNMALRNENQSIIVSGESGAGKTESAKHAMRYFAQVGGGDSDTQVEKRVLASNPIMEAFGNAKTIRNDNSSRFGKYMEIQFDAKHHIVGAVMRTYLLEKTRVVFQAFNERNFHIFYQLCAAAATNSHPDLASLKIPAVQDFQYTFFGQNPVIDGVDDAKNFETVCKSMTMVGITSEQQSNVFRILASILHLGSISIRPQSKRDDKATIDDDDAHLLIAAELLQIDCKALNKWLCNRKIQAVKEVVITLNTSQEAIFSRDALSKHIYAVIFDWLVVHINAALSHPEKTRTFIGVLDIYGFETFEVNSFEQFCINYANEKLQQQFNQHVFKLEQEEYVREQIDWSFIDFYDNQPCIDLIEDKMGIIALLDEECRVPKGTDKTFVEKLEKNLIGKYEHFSMPRMDHSKFIVKHYANQVCYNSEGFLNKNRDTINEQQILTLAASTNPLVASLFTEVGEESAKDKLLSKTGRPASMTQKTTKSAKMTVSCQFKQSLSDLMAALNSTTPHYVRCIKPNEEKAPFEFNMKNCIHQLRACGVLETIRISAAGYPGRWKYHDFYERYNLLLTRHGKLRWDRTNDRKSAELICTDWLKNPELYRLGKTKLFFRAGQVAYLEKVRADTLLKSAIVIQKRVRGWFKRRAFLRLRKAVVTMQKYVRGLLACRLARRLRREKAALVLQTRWRGHAARQKYVRTVHNVVRVQACIRAFFARKRVIALRRLNAAKTIQHVWRGHVVRRDYRNKVKQITLLQSLVRRRAAMKELKALRAEAKSMDHLRKTAWGLENKVIEYKQRLDESLRDVAVLREQIQQQQQSAQISLVAHQQTVAQLTAARDADRLQLTSAQEQITLLEKSLAALQRLHQEYVANAEKQAATKDLELKHERQQISQVTDKLGSAQLTISKLEEQLAAIRTDNEQVGSQLVSLTSERKSLLAQTENLTNELTELRIELEEKKRPSLANLVESEPEPDPELIAAQAAVQLGESKIAELSEMLSLTRKAAEHAQAELEALHTQLAHVEQERQNFEIEYHKECEKSHQRELQLQAAATTSASEFDDTYTNTLLAEKTELEKMVSQLKMEFSKAEAKATKFKESADAAIEEAAYHDKEVTRLTAENAALKAQLEEAQRRKGSDSVGLSRQVSALKTDTIKRTPSLTDAPPPAGVFKFEEADEAKIVDHVITNFRPTMAAGSVIGVAGHVLFMCARFADFSRNAKLIQSFLTNVTNALKQVTLTYQNDRETLAFWLSNVIVLLSDLRYYGTDVEQKELMKNFDLTEYKAALTDVAMNLYRCFLKCVEVEMCDLLIVCILDYDGLLNPASTKDRMSTKMVSPAAIIAILNGALGSLHRANVPQPVIAQLVEHLFQFIGATLLNNILLRKALCRSAKGMSILYNISELTNWCYTNKLAEAVNCNAMVKVHQCLQLLQIPKTASAEEILNVCSDLLPIQIQKVLTMFVPDDFEDKVPPKLIVDIGKLNKNYEQNELMAELPKNSTFKIPYGPVTVDLTKLVLPAALENSLQGVLCK